MAAHFAPTSLVDPHADLLGHHPRLLGIDPHDHDAREQALQSARRDAVAEILDSGGLAELLPPLGTGGSDGEVARGYAGARIEADGLDWVARQLQRWSDGESVPQQVGLLLAVPWPNAGLHRCH